MLTTTLILALLGLTSSFVHPAAPSHSSALAAAASRHTPPPILQETAAPDKLLTCSRCKASYEINQAEFGAGKQVECSNCGHAWFQTGDRLQDQPDQMDLVEYPEEMKARIAAGKPAEAVGRFRCFVGNLPWGLTEDDLRELFESYGTIASVVIMADENGRPKGFGFVNFEDPVAGAAAVAALDGAEVEGRSLTVSEGKQRTSRAPSNHAARAGAPTLPPKLVLKQIPSLLCCGAQRTVAMAADVGVGAGAATAVAVGGAMAAGGAAGEAADAAATIRKARQSPRTRQRLFLSFLQFPSKSCNESPLLIFGARLCIQAGLTVRASPHVKIKPEDVARPHTTPAHDSLAQLQENWRTFDRHISLGASLHPEKRSSLKLCVNPFARRRSIDEDGSSRVHGGRSGG